MKIYAVTRRGEWIQASAFACGWEHPVDHFDEAGNPVELITVDKLPAQFKSADAGLKTLSLGAIGVAWFIRNIRTAREDREAQQLLRRWKTIHGKYAQLSKRYAAFAVRMASIQFTDPVQPASVYAALNVEFDALTPAMQALHDDLKAWEKANIVVDEVSEAEIAECRAVLNGGKS